MLQITAILTIVYVATIVYDFYKYEEHWQEILKDSEEEK
jgi:hypothetical protein